MLAVVAVASSTAFNSILWILLLLDHCPGDRVVYPLSIPFYGFLLDSTFSLLIARLPCFQFHFMDSRGVRLHSPGPHLQHQAFNSILWIPIGVVLAVLAAQRFFQFHFMDSGCWGLWRLWEPLILLSIPFYGFLKDIWSKSQTERDWSFNSILWIHSVLGLVCGAYIAYYFQFHFMDSNAAASKTISMNAAMLGSRLTFNSILWIPAPDTLLQYMQCWLFQFHFMDSGSVRCKR